MPAPLPIILKNKVYMTPILNEEMDNVANQIATKKEEIASLNSQLTTATAELANLQNQFMLLYINVMGSFPS
jgi:uncharacterized coiled-coil protein SlyX